MSSHSDKIDARWANEVVPTDLVVMDLLRKQPSQTIAELAQAMEVTATAVRQRLNRLMGQGYVERVTCKVGRGRPTHKYRLTNKGERKAGANYADLAVALWEEVRSIDDPELKRAMITRIAKRLVEMYADDIRGEDAQQRIYELTALFTGRQIPLEYEEDNQGRPVLNVLACPYPDLAEQDRAVCVLEKAMFAELLGQNMTLSQCRLDGEDCCTYELSQPSADSRSL